MAIWNNNAKAPRFGKAAFTQNLLSYALYQKWKIATGHRLKYAEWRKIAISLLERYMIPIFDGDESELPQYAGEVSVKCVQLKEGKTAIDIKKSKLVKKIVPFMAFATDGKIGKIVWKADKARKFNARLTMLGFEAETKYTDMAAIAFVERTGDFKMAKTTLNK